MIDIDQAEALVVGDVLLGGLVTFLNAVLDDREGVGPDAGTDDVRSGGPAADERLECVKILDFRPGSLRDDEQTTAELPWSPCGAWRS
ncbi:hypothetical protein V5T10_07555 [Corynebacterium bovis]|nr:hypothetical protein [Corynebacterium bovis]